MSCTVSQEWSVILAEFLLAEKEETRVWLRTEMDRLMDPMLDTIFNRLFKQLETNGMKRRQSGGVGCGSDCGQLIMNHNGQMHQFFIDQPSSHVQNVHYSYQQPTNDPIHCNENIYQQYESIPFVQPTMYPYSQVNFEQVSNEPTDYCPSLSPTTVSNLQSNYNSNDQNLICEDENEDEDECYCDECLGVIELDDEVEDDDDDSDSVQCIKNEQKDEESIRPAKRSRIDPTQSNNATQPEMDRQNQQIVEAQPNQVNHQDKLIITVSLQCPESDCLESFSMDELNQSVNQLEKHLKDEHSIGPFQCLVKDCKQSFDSRLIRGDHIKQFHQHTTQLLCDKCSKQFSKYPILANHNYLHHQLGHFECSFPSCTFTGENRQKMYDHYTQQHRQTLNCQHFDCNYQATSAHHLKQHQRTHSGNKPYRCKWPGCQFATKRNNSAIKHIRRKHLAPKPGSVPNGAQLDPKDYVEVVHELLE